MERERKKSFLQLPPAHFLNKPFFLGIFSLFLPTSLSHISVSLSPALGKKAKCCNKAASGLCPRTGFRLCPTRAALHRGMEALERKHDLCLWEHVLSERQLPGKGALVLAPRPTPTPPPENQGKRNRLLSSHFPEDQDPREQRVVGPESTPPRAHGAA